MYAIIETGGKQYRVEEGSKIVVEKLAAQSGSESSLDKVLLLGRGPKIKVFKRWRRNGSRKMGGHRQECTTLRVKSING